MEKEKVREYMNLTCGSVPPQTYHFMEGIFLEKENGELSKL